jgi:hypothetical protein
MNGNGGSTTPANATTLIDLSSAYAAGAAAQMSAAANAAVLNSNRTSPFDPSNAFLQLNAANSSNPAVLNSILAANHQSVAAAAAASNVPVQNGNYFTNGNYLTTSFQSQLQDRINI